MILKKSNNTIQLSQETIKVLLQTNADFINAPLYNNSIKTVMEQYPEGLPDKTIAKYLGLTLDELKTQHQNICQKIRQRLQ